MAGSLGELFIQLAFEGDTKEADKFIKKTQELIDIADKEIKKNKLRIQYLHDLAETQDKTQKKLLTDNYVKEFKKLNLTKQLDEAKNKQVLQKNAVMDAAKAFAGYIATISGAVYAVKKLTDSLIQQNQTWLNLTRTSDIALSAFQKWNAIGRMYGIDNAAQQIKNLNDRLFELKLTGANAQGFILAGINPTNADDVMEQLRNRVSGLDDTAASYLLRQMGIDENMLHILRLSREEFSALNAEMKRYRLTPEQQKNIQEMNVQLQIASQKLQYLKDRAILAIMPAWTSLIESIARVTEFLARAAVLIGRFIKQFRGLFLLLAGFVKLPKKLLFIDLKPLLAVLLKIRIFILQIIKPVLFFATKFKTELIIILSKLPIIGKFIAGMSSAAVLIGKLLAKWLLPLTAVYLLIDDIMTTMQGGDSLIGDLFKFFRQIAKDISNIWDSFKLDPFYALASIFIKIFNIINNAVRFLLRTIDILAGTPLAKWWDKHIMNDDYKAGIEQWRDRLQKNSLEAQYGRTAEPNMTNYNNRTSNNTIGDYSPTYNITIDSPVGQKMLQNIQKNDFTHSNYYFSQSAAI